MHNTLDNVRIAHTLHDLEEFRSETILRSNFSLEKVLFSAQKEWLKENGALIHEEDQPFY